MFFFISGIDFRIMNPHGHLPFPKITLCRQSDLPSRLDASRYEALLSSFHAFCLFFSCVCMMSSWREGGFVMFLHIFFCFLLHVDFVCNPIYLKQPATSTRPYKQEHSHQLNTAWYTTSYCT
jgi:hypothetical protein